jgi:hypothetical protein
MIGAMPKHGSWTGKVESPRPGLTATAYPGEIGGRMGSWHRGDALAGRGGMTARIIAFPTPAKDQAPLDGIEAARSRVAKMSPAKRFEAASILQAFAAEMGLTITVHGIGSGGRA